MICKECGKPIDDDSKFCRYCGKEASHAPSVEPAPQPKEVKEVGKDMEDLLKDSRLIGYTFKNWWLINLSGIIAIGFWSLFFLYTLYSWIYSPIEGFNYGGSFHWPPFIVLVTKLVLYGSIIAGIYGYCLPALNKLKQIRKAGFYDEGGLLGNGFLWGIFFGILLLVVVVMSLPSGFTDIVDWVMVLIIAILPFFSAMYFCFTSNKILSNPERHLLERREIELN